MVVVERETEFKEISPVKSRTNQRLYRKKDVELIQEIKELLYRQGFTIQGARKKLKDDHKGRSKIVETESPQLGFELEEKVEVKIIKNDLDALRNSLQTLSLEMKETLN